MTTQIHSEMCKDLFAFHEFKASDEEIEKALLSAILHQPKIYDEIVFLTDQHFTNYHCRFLFGKMQELKAESKEPEFSIVAHHYDKTMMRGLAEIYQVHFAAYQARTYAQALHELYQYRTMLHGMKISLNAHAYGTKAKESFQILKDSIMSVERIDLQERMISGDEAAYAQIKQLEEYMNGRAHIRTGLSKLDEYTGGISQGLTIIGAKSGIGKTAFLCSIAHNMMSDTHKVGILSGEMKATDIADRLVSIYSGKPIANTHFKQNDLKNEYSDVITAAAHYPQKHKYIIDDSPLHVFSLRAKISKMVREGCEVIFIDYLQRIKGNENSSLRENIIDASMTLANAAKEYKIPIVALVQLNRDTDKSHTKEPELHHISESGQIEMDADLILLLHRPEKYGIEMFDDTEPTAGRAEVIIAKNRFGAVAKFRCDYNGELMQFKDTQQKTIYGGANW